MAVLDRVPVERITAEAREVEVGRMLVTLIAGLFYVLGWLAAKLTLAIGFVLVFAWTAVRLGWQEAGGPRPRGRAHGTA